MACGYARVSTHEQNLDLQEDPDRSFEEKFEAQLADASQAANRLAAEAVGVYLLFAVNAIDTFVRFDTAQTAMDVVVVVTYIGLNECGAPFFGAMVGTAAV